MPRKLNIEHVSEFVLQKSNGLSQVLSTEYINDREPLKIKCKCGNVFQRPFSKIRGKGRTAFCKDCLNDIRSEKYRLNFNEVIQYINSNDCEFISGDYENENSKLTIKCKCGNVFQKSFGKFKSGQNRCPMCGTESLRQSKFKYSVEDVKKSLSEKGYTIIDESEYVDCVKPIRCNCKRGHQVNIKYLFFLKNQSGCRKCANIENSGENHWNYGNGESLVVEALRHSINFWKKEIKELYGNKCPITHETTYLTVHHLISFDVLLKQASEEINIPIHQKIGDYEDYNDFILLKDKVIEKHSLDMGIPIRKKVHLQFHSKYGKGNNTPEQFNKFLKDFYNISLDEVVLNAKLQ